MSLSVCVLSLFVILGRDVRVRMNNLATTSAWENYYLVDVAVQGPPLAAIQLVRVRIKCIKHRRPSTLRKIA